MILKNFTISNVRKHNKNIDYYQIKNSIHITCMRVNSHLNQIHKIVMDINFTISGKINNYVQKQNPSHLDALEIVLPKVVPHVSVENSLITSILTQYVKNLAGDNLVVNVLHKKKAAQIQIF